MKKIIVISVLALAIAAIGGILLFSKKSNQGAVNNGALSSRAREFINQRKYGSDTTWNSAQVDEKAGKETVSPEINDAQCFSLNIPLSITQQRKEGECSYFAATSDPSGQIVTYINHTNTPLDEDSGVIIRRKNPDYKEERLTVNGRDYLIFGKINEGYEKTAMYQNGSKLFVLNLIVNTNENLDKYFLQMLQSVKIYNE